MRTLMEYIYLNNFRGFENTFVQMQKVNFLVGQNSSGKTSFLFALKLINQFNLGSPNFHSKKNNLGSFSDICNKGSETFELGSIHIDQEAPHNNTVFIASFSEREGLPVLNKVFWIKHHIVNEFKYSATRLRNKIYALDKSINSSNFNEEISELVRQRLQDKTVKGFKSFLKDVPRPETFPLLDLGEYFTKDSHKLHSKWRKSVKPPSLLSKNFRDYAPIREKPRRLYEPFAVNFSPEGGHLPYKLKEITNPKKSKKDNSLSQPLIKEINKFGKESGLYDNIEVKHLANNKASPFQINVELKKQSFNIKNVGYGVSQILPVVVDAVSMPSNILISIQQPEVHLHPKAQAAFGSLLYPLAKKSDKSFFIETHSDYLIDRFRLEMSKSYKKTPKQDSNAQVIFFEKTKKGNQTQSIPILNNGKYESQQPAGFRDFFIKEQIDLLQI